MPLPSIEPNDNIGSAFLKFNSGAEKPFIHFINFLMRNNESPLIVAQRELIGAFVSGLNNCSYCYGSHAAVAEQFGVDKDLLEDLVTDIDKTAFDEQFKPILHFVKKLTLDPSKMVQDDVDNVLSAGWSERALYDAILVCCAFNFTNRMVDGLGLTTLPDSFSNAAKRLLGGYDYFADKLR
ncbi:MAG: peroxidase-related enzyme [Bacteroidota bacterium]|nr:peroxidase-related enzyme [Bacteroidota bacterium]